MSESGTPSFRSRGIGELIDASFKFFTRDLKTLSIVALICNLPALACEVAAFFLPDQSSKMILGLLLIILNFLAGSIMVGAVTYVVGDRYLGRELGAGDAMRRAWANFGRIFHTQFLVGLWIFLGMLCIFIPGVIWYFTLSLAVPVAILEGVGGAPALERSKVLVKYNRNKVVSIVFGMLLLVMVLGFAIGASWGLCTGLVLTGAPLAVVNVLGSRVLGYLISPLYSVSLVMLYYDLRISHEAFDLEMLSSNLEPS